MTQIHTCYEVSKRLKEFLGESAPEPIEDNKCAYYGKDLMCYVPEESKTERHRYTFDGYAYRLEDLLSKPFITAMEKKMYSPEVLEDGYDEMEHYHQILNAWVDGGMEAVEKALLEMMEAK